ncbi:hypothetical protein DSO57_1021558 [Entomophthora muscae]|uniref:Uncharacterized protein n=1 Tax=Entomophthora muscae TaxID=34485 RepID=A0ACC2U199_9FUNG|nr:hypothetical protein DSO57_1021558 [Entomophthora muscae]
MNASGIERMVRVVYKPQAYEIRMNDTLEWELIQGAFCKIFKIQPPIHVAYFHNDCLVKVDNDDTLRTFIREDLPEHRLEVALASELPQSPKSPEPEPKPQETFTPSPTPVKKEHQTSDFKTINFDPLKRASEFKDMCRSYQDLFHSYPQLVVLNEFFVDQILNGVHIDFDVFEKGLQRHSILSSSFPAPSRQSDTTAASSSNGGYNPKPSSMRDYFYAGSDMAD